MDKVANDTLENRWAPNTIPVSAFPAKGTGADLTAITFAVVEVRSGSTASTMVLGIGNVELVPNGLAKAKFVNGFDD